MTPNRTYVFDLHVVPAQAMLVALLDLLDQCKEAHRQHVGREFVPTKRPLLPARPAPPSLWWVGGFFGFGAGTGGGFD